jgi:hypothetical protein
MRDIDDYAYGQERYGSGFGSAFGTDAFGCPIRYMTAEEEAASKAAKAKEEEDTFRAAMADAMASGGVCVTSAHRIRHRRFWEGRKGRWEDYKLPAGETWTEWEGLASTVDANGTIRVRVAVPAQGYAEPTIIVLTVTADGRHGADLSIQAATAKLPQ